MLEEPLVGLISNIRILGAPELAEELSGHLMVVKSLLDEFNQIKTSNRDIFAADVATFNVTTRDVIWVQLKQQIADETARLENIS